MQAPSRSRARVTALWLCLALLTMSHLSSTGGCNIIQRQCSPSSHGGCLCLSTRVTISLCLRVQTQLQQSASADGRCSSDQISAKKQKLCRLVDSWCQSRTLFLSDVEGLLHTTRFGFSKSFQVHLHKDSSFETVYIPTAYEP